MTGARDRPRLNADLAGKELGTSSHTVTAEAIEAYARATNDLNSRYLAGAEAVASPVWPVVPAFPSFMAAARDPELRADLTRLLHASEEHVLLRPIRPGDVLTVRSVLESVAPHPAGETFTVAAFESDAEGRPVAEVRGTMLIRGPATREPASRPEERRGEVVHEQTTHVDDDQMRRYADASGDHNPIHLDPAAARRAGLRRPILHGMATMAMATAGAVDGLAAGDPTRVRRVRVAFARPVVPGHKLTTRFWESARRGAVTTYGFETVAEGDVAVVTGAEVDVADSPSG